MPRNADRISSRARRRAVEQALEVNVLHRHSCIAPSSAASVDRSQNGSESQEHGNSVAGSRSWSPSVAQLGARCTADSGGDDPVLSVDDLMKMAIFIRRTQTDLEGTRMT